MKKDRNYMPYPIYPMNQYYPNVNMMPGQNMINNSYEETIQNLQGQINMLDKRVSYLENHLNKDYNKYNDSNYHIM